MHRQLFPVLAFFTAICDATGQEGAAQVYEKLRQGRLNQTETKRVMQQDFDLQRPEVSGFMVGQMNRVGKRDDSPSSAIQFMMEIDPGKTLEWLIENYRNLEPAGRRNLTRSLGPLDCQEVYRLLTPMLDDQALVIDEYAARMWPGPGEWLHHRICDDAYNRLVLQVGWDSGLLPTDLPKVIYGTDPMEKRDIAIQKFKVWWKDAMEGIVSKKPSLATNRPSIGQKLNELLQRRAASANAVVSQPTLPTPAPTSSLTQTTPLPSNPAHEPAANRWPWILGGGLLLALLVLLAKRSK